MCFILNYRNYKKLNLLEYCLNFVVVLIVQFYCEAYLSVLIVQDS